MLVAAIVTAAIVGGRLTGGGAPQVVVVPQLIYAQAMAGFDGHLVKPVHPETLAKLLGSRSPD